MYAAHLFQTLGQTDTSLAIETKFMKRWEFDSVAQAARCMPSWFSGTDTEHHLLKVCLESTIGILYLHDI